MADGIALFEVKREEEFAPVKNATGNDSPESARCLMSQLHQSWLKSQGVVFESKKINEEPADADNLCEVDTALSYAGEGLEFFKKYFEQL